MGREWLRFSLPRERPARSGGARDGDELKNLPPDGVQLPGVSRADIRAAIDYAEQHAWIGKQPGDQYYRLTEAGVRAGQPSAYSN
jgi:hypothetical protein